MNPTFLFLAQSGGNSQANPLFTWILLGVMGAALYFLMWRPQQKRQRETAQFASKLSPGDQVITASGIYGTVNLVEDDCVHLEVDRDVVIRVTKSAIVRSQEQPESPKKS